ncbi:U6 snRNA-associated Sm-like protein LSm7 isoform X2 [Crassostrea virginica]
MSQAPKQNQQSGDKDKEKKKKETILDLAKYLDKTIRVKFSGGREAAGVLKGYDPLLNLVLDDTTEYLRDPDDPYNTLSLSEADNSFQLTSFFSHSFSIRAD